MTYSTEKQVQIPIFACLSIYKYDGTILCGVILNLRALQSLQQRNRSKWSTL